VSVPQLRIVADAPHSEGVQSDASNGFLVIKPCTAAEIAFYESAAEHGAFQSHMPALIGTLKPSDQSGGAFDAISALEGRALPDPFATLAPSAYLPANGASNPLGHHSHRATPSLSQLPVSKRTSWKPSGGKKIDTGLAIVLENVAHGFKHPNILDIKLGARLWADDAPAAKRQKLDDASQQTTSASLGFRIAGMTIWIGTSEDSRTEELPDKDAEIKNGYIRYTKRYGWTFTKENVKIAFVKYFGGANADGKLRYRRSKLIIKRIARELESIAYVLENEESRMYSASVLIVYEGDDQALGKALQEETTRNIEDPEQNSAAELNSTTEENNDGDDESDEPDPKVHDVRLIDFAHAQWTPGQGPDENVLIGVRSVLKILNELAEQNAG
jgi:1D-myo-inositol-tetrakisphosphate 5-kinase/inositol-polyphosphate multikinase